MGNLGGMEVVVILLVALVVLGPKKLPEATRQVARALAELKRISSGFQREMREAIEDPVLEAEARAKGARVTASAPAADPADPVGTDSAAESPTGPDAGVIDSSSTETEAAAENSDSRTSAS
ncbi:MAG: Sec-independent protein translocase protein TatB [Acidimicrobiaceae bacterium]|nr:Sec-independent protein translocase protein TatB [Acidimicrobiaceae bacterium]